MITAPPRTRSAVNRLNALATRLEIRASTTYAAADRAQTVGQRRLIETLGDAYQDAADELRRIAEEGDNDAFPDFQPAG